MGGVPKISIVIAAYNAAQTLPRAVAAACAQTIDDLEILIADDASPDATLAVAEELASHDARIRVLSAETNGGPGAARNMAIDAARGEWIAVLDADDQMAPERMARMLAVAAEYDADLVADNLRLQPEGEAEAAARAFLPTEPAFVETLSPHAYVDRNHFYKLDAKLGYLKPLIRRSVLRPDGPRYDERLRIGEDYQLCLDLLLAGRRYVIFSEPLYIYTTEQSVSVSFRWNCKVIAELLRANGRAMRDCRSADPGLQAALAFRRQQLRKAYRHQRCIDWLKAKKIGRALALVVARPEIAPLVADSLLAAMRKRLIGAR